MKAGYGLSEADRGVCDLSRLTVNYEPFPHVIRDQFIEPEIYRQLCESFPSCPPSTGPTGYSLYWGDDDYQLLLDTEIAWRALFNTFHNQHFIDWAREQFAPLWRKLGCAIDLSKARYVPYREDRVDKERAALRCVDHEPDELWGRLDIHQGAVGYSRAIHVDHRRRLMSMLIYLCDQKENQMQGGELLLHNAAHTPVKRINPQHDLMVAFPCTGSSYHSVTPITSLAAPRNYVQVHISSSVDIWDPQGEKTINLTARHPQFNSYSKYSFADLRATSIPPDRNPSSALRSSDCLDLETSRAKLLGSLEGASDITVIRNPGNMGDHLIHAGMRRLLKGVDYREVSLWKLDGERGEVAILSGSGAWCKAHQHLPPYLPQIEKQFERVIVFPTSFDPTVKEVREVLSRTRALVFAREFSSYEQIRHLCRSDVAHDTAFFFDFELHRRPGRGTLLAFRTDGEALTPAVPPGNRDVAVACESLDEFLWTIARHEVVKTDRAHVLIAAALLGKDVHFSATNYHKVPALAASSLQNYPISFVPDLRGKLTNELKTAGANAQSESAGDREIIPKSELDQLRDLADERGRLLDEILTSKSFRLVSFYWRLRRYLSRR